MCTYIISHTPTLTRTHTHLISLSTRASLYFLCHLCSPPLLFRPSSGSSSGLFSSLQSLWATLRPPTSFLCHDRLAGRLARRHGCAIITDAAGVVPLTVSIINMKPLYAHRSPIHMPAPLPSIALLPLPLFPESRRPEAMRLSGHMCCSSLS
ncbi:hypothetical protein B0T20DRAFT_427605 [Sordaria brevicollis]|uniref:Uncharacterized protein n=1 Tax=Sordaria brevicollis TaxID=83679 RepID=A0AAE0U0D0_SORBR|nr:hypothetical protein B0T20DRAFT_427605 [Sordaria brevicollis]